MEEEEEEDSSGSMAISNSGNAKSAFKTCNIKGLVVGLPLAAKIFSHAFSDKALQPKP